MLEFVVSQIREAIDAFSPSQILSIMLFCFFFLGLEDLIPVMHFFLVEVLLPKFLHKVSKFSIELFCPGQSDSLDS